MAKFLDCLIIERLAYNGCRVTCKRCDKYSCSELNRFFSHP